MNTIKLVKADDDNRRQCLMHELKKTDWCVKLRDNLTLHAPNEPSS